MHFLRKKAYQPQKFKRSIRQLFAFSQEKSISLDCHHKPKFSFEHSISQLVFKECNRLYVSMQERLDVSDFLVMESLTGY
jgi:hypothetical protein